jgi:hypothetical protein
MWPLRRKPELKPVAAAPAWDSGLCGARMYEPGADHEHFCLATSKHPGLDHTCGHVPREPYTGEEIGPCCCKTWSGEGEPARPSIESRGRLMSDRRNPKWLGPMDVNAELLYSEYEHQRARELYALGHHDVAWEDADRHTRGEYLQRASREWIRDLARGPLYARLPDPKLEWTWPERLLLAAALLAGIIVFFGAVVGAVTQP